MLKIKKKIQMHIAQRKELDVHKTKQKRDRNRTTTSLVLDSSMQRGRWEFRLNQRIWLCLSSVFDLLKPEVNISGEQFRLIKPFVSSPKHFLLKVTQCLL